MSLEQSWSSNQGRNKWNTPISRKLKQKKIVTQKKSCLCEQWHRSDCRLASFVEMEIKRLVNQSNCRNKFMCLACKVVKYQLHKYILYRFVKDTIKNTYRYSIFIMYWVLLTGEVFLIRKLACIDPMHKWLLIKISFLSIKISPTNLVFELIIQKNFYSQTRLVGLI